MSRNSESYLLPKKSIENNIANFTHGHGPEHNDQGQGHKQTGKQVNRETNGQGHRRTGTQTDRDRDTDGQVKGDRRAETGTQKGRDTEKDRQEQDIDRKVQGY
jgi:hypothetical protein